MLRLGLLLSTTVILSSCDWLLPPGDQTSPDYWADYFLDKYADELVVGDLEPGPTPLEEPRTVLLITGVTIRAEWFNPIVARLQRDGFVPVVYEPPALLSYDLFEASEDLADVVEQVLEESGQERIDILAECTGGLIARHYIQSLGGDETVSRMVTFVSPQNGIDKAPLAAAIAGWPALDDLTPGSDFLHAVNDVPLPEDIPFTSIYTCSDEYIQPYETSIIPGANNIGLCDGFVGHFQTFYDPEIYLIMHGALTEPTIFDLEEPGDEEPAEEPGEGEAPIDPTDPGDETGETGSDEGGSDEGGSDEGGSDEGGSDEGGSDEGGSYGEGASGAEGMTGNPRPLPGLDGVPDGASTLDDEAAPAPAVSEGAPAETMGCSAAGASGAEPAFAALALLLGLAVRRRSSARHTDKAAVAGVGG